MILRRSPPPVPTYWSVPRLWEGETVFILGGGPSFGLIDPATIPAPMIAVNNAYLRCPDADVLYFADRRWYQWNKNDLHRYRGPHIVSRSYIGPNEGGSRQADVKWIERDYGSSLSERPTAIAGWCGGANAVNIAFLGGARRIVLLGFDMRPGNWHDLHQKRPLAHQHARNFIPSLARMGSELKTRGVEIINATPGSALTAFPIVSPERFGMVVRELEKEPA